MESPSQGQQEALQGLSSREAALLHRAGKGNNPPKVAGRTTGQIVLRNLFTWFNMLNFILAAALLSVHSYRNLLFMGVVILNTFVGTFQEIRAKRTVDKLSLLVAAPARVMRDGAWMPLPIEELVEGDLVELHNGDQVSADAYVLSGEGAADESLLTGESEPVAKQAGSHLYSGSFITQGQLRCRLTGVGSLSYAGQLVQSVRHVKASRSQLMDDMKKMIRVISYFLLPIGALLFLKQHFRLGDALEQAIPAAVAAVLGMIPEGLMLLTSMALAVGVVRLGSRGTLVQELYGIENLARVNTLCVDKTGTITKGSLTLEECIPLEGAVEAEVQEAMRLFLGVSQDENSTFDALRKRWPATDREMPEPLHRIPFSSSRKWSALHFSGRTLVIGAPEFVLKDAPAHEVLELADIHAARGLRVLLLAQSQEAPQAERLPNGLAPLALLTLHDEIREDFEETASYLGREGVELKVISGDNPLTVAEVARRAGLPGAGDWVDASTLTTQAALEAAAGEYTVFGRISPEQKRQLVLALKGQGRTVAMMGDGVNDVPALKVCDCAIAMAGGSDAARRVSQLTLLKENFSALPDIILEGRRVINNITRSASLFLVKTCFSYLLSLLLLLLPLSYPFHPIQMTLVSSFTVGIPAFFLALIPNRERVRGGFLKSIFLNALPGALNNLLLIGLLFILRGAAGLGQDEIATISVGVVALTGLLVLAYTCVPLDRGRLVLIALMALGMLLCALFFPGLFLLAPLFGAAPWLLLMLSILSPFSLYFLRRVLKTAFPA